MNISRFIIDAKQPKEFQHQLRQAYPDAQVLNLGEASGDLLVQLEQKTVAVEVKEVPNDFLASIQDRRLFRQSEGLRALTPFAFLLLGGDFKYDATGHVLARRASGYGPVGWTRDQVEGALTRVQAAGVMTRIAYHGYVEAVRLLLEWVDGCDTGAVTRPPVPLSPFDAVSQEAVNLITLPRGIGVVEAKAFLDWTGVRPRYKYLELLTTPFGAKDRPRGWTNHKIEKWREFLELQKHQRLAVTYQEEWKEVLDE